MALNGYNLEDSNYSLWDNVYDKYSPNTEFSPEAARHIAIESEYLLLRSVLHAKHHIRSNFNPPLWPPRLLPAHSNPTVAAATSKPQHHQPHLH
jgi:hypothetical protein